ncbi:MAG: YitT family protein [Clostridia bacterium]|nr:YitT family protein [Clostridia bacterium]
MKKFFIDISISIFGCILAAFGTGCFLLPNKLSSGGFSGISTILYYLFGWKMGVTIILMNIPIFVLSYIKLGRRFFIKTIISTIIFSQLIDFFEKINLDVNDKFLASIYGGILIGIGLSLVFRQNASTGGTDLISTLVQTYNPRIKTGQILVVLDFVIVLANLIVFKNLDVGLYSFIAIYLVSKMIDLVAEGINFTKMIYIISDKHKDIAKLINLELGRGSTELYGKGSYTGKDKMIILCATKRSNIIKIKEMVNKVDPNAFMIISDAREVYGLGFK